MLDFVPTIALAAIAIIIGFGGLIWSADRFVSGAASIAEAFGVAPVVIGLTIVSFGTSAPEVMVSLMASARDAGDLAVGNALGSNIANVAMVLGITLLISKIPVDVNLLKHEFSVLFFLILLSGVFLYDSEITATEGWILLALLVPSVWYLVVIKQKDHSPEELISDEVEHYSPAMAWIWFFVGLIALLVSSKLLVWGGETTALHFGVSPLIIGLTVIAIGTSLPELAASVMSALKGHHDIAIGAIVGSNMFNLLAVMSLPGIFGTPPMESAVFSRDYMAMLITALALFTCICIVLLTKKTSAEGQTPSSAPEVGKMTGALLSVMYIGYIVILAKVQIS